MLGWVMQAVVRRQSFIFFAATTPSLILTQTLLVSLRNKNKKGFDANMEAAIASGDPLAIIPLLPRVFEFVFAQMEEIKRDTANAHIRLIAPYLARHGAPYERAKFEVRAS